MRAKLGKIAQYFEVEQRNYEILAYDTFSS